MSEETKEAKPTEPAEEKKSDTERILDTLLKISEKVIDIQRVVLDLQIKQRAGRF